MRPETSEIGVGKTVNARIADPAKTPEEPHKEALRFSSEETTHFIPPLLGF